MKNNIDISFGRVLLLYAGLWAQSAERRAQGAEHRAKGIEQGTWSLEFPNYHLKVQRDNMNNINNYKQNKPHLLTLGGSKYKTIPCLPRGGFNSGVCPGAATITILYSYTGSPRGTLGGSHTPVVTNSYSHVEWPKAKEGLPMI